MKRILRKSTALLLTVCMIFTMFPLTALAAPGDSGTRVAPDEVAGGINGYMAGLKADADTRDGYKTAFDVQASSDGAVEISSKWRSAKLNGKIWADKSVKVGEDGKTFDVTLSALGQTFANTTVTRDTVAFDVMFVVDRSTSMGFDINTTGDSWDYPDDPDNSRMAATVNALNAAADVLLAEGSQNRIGVVAFAGSVGDNIIPLGTYEKEANATFFSHRTSGIWSQRSSGFSFNSKTTSKDISLDGSTNPQEGILEAARLLNNATLSESGVKRIPVIILLTDGEPNQFTKQYTGSSTGSADATGISGNQEDYYYTICSAAYQKDVIQQQYRDKQKKNDIEAKFYTIGLGINSTGQAALMLNPSLGTGATGASALLEDIQNNSPSKMGFSAYEYADGSWTGTISNDALEDIFDSIIGEITSITGGESVGESTGGRNKMTFFETLGDQVRLNGEFTLEVPTYTTEDGEMKAGPTRTYTLEAFTSADGGQGTELTGPEAQKWVEEGNTLYLRPTGVSVDGGSAGNLDSNNSYDKAALEELSVTVRQLQSGKRQLQAAIPPGLMAYNVLNEKTTEDQQTTHSYYESDPVRFHYSAALMDSADAGTYLIGEPSQSYLHFNPSSVQNDGGDYVMPYYWESFKDNGGVGDTVNKDGDKVAGSSDYVTTTAWNQGGNNDVRIYLGNNGQYTLSGKSLTFHLFWKDDDNVDNQRFENMRVQLYQEFTDQDLSAEPVQPPTDAKPYFTQENGNLVDGKEGIPMGISNVPENDSDLWEQLFSDLPVYSENGENIRYWLQFLPWDGQEADSDRGYKVGINRGNDGHENGILISEGDSYWFCFGVDQGLKSDAELDVQFERERDTVTYTIQKIWDSSSVETNSIPDSVQFQLYANGQPVDEQGNAVTSGDRFITVEKSEGWSKILTLPKNSAGGQPISYTPVETGDAAKNFTALTDYQTIRDDQENITGYKATVTNYSSVEETALTAVKVWDDGDDQDGNRPENVSFELKAMIGAEEATPDQYEQLLDGQNQEITVSEADDWRCTWSHLPKAIDGSSVTYSAAESGVPVGYTSETSTDIEGYVFVTNTYTPEVVNLTIKKDWVDKDDQDGIRPESGISGMLYKKAGEAGEITAVRSFATQKAGDADSVTIENLPRYENGKLITYYVSEDAVKGYNVSVEGVEGKQLENGVTVYPVKMSDDGESGSITLENSHTPATINYTVKFKWDDYENQDNARPESFQVRLADSQNDQKEYFIELELNSDGDIIRADWAPESSLPEGVSVAWEGGALVIKGLPQYADGVQLDYGVRVVEDTIDPYTAVMTDYTVYSNSFTLSYEAKPISLSFTKVWEDDGHSDARPETSSYSRYLTLERSAADGDPEIVYTRFQIVEEGNAYTVTYSNLDKYDQNGNLYVYTVTESNVPNYKADKTTLTLTGDSASEDKTIKNTFEQEVYEEITVTKVWNDADGKNNRPQVPNLAEGDADPLNVRLYKTNGDQSSPEEGIKAASIDRDPDNENQWIYTWTNVPKRDADGSVIAYTAYENEIPDAYVQYEERDSERYADIGLNGIARSEIVNTLEGTSIATGSLTIEKKWFGDGDYKDTSRPENVSFTIFGVVDNAENADTFYTVTIEKPDDNADIWSVTKEGLPLTKDGKQVKYYVVENGTASDYKAVYSHTSDNAVSLNQDKAVTVTVTNTYTPNINILSYDANGGIGDVPGIVRVEPANPETTVAGEPLPKYAGAIFAGWSTETTGMITSEDQLNAVKLYGPDTANKTITVDKNITLYAVWLQDANGNGTPDYEETSATVTLIWEDAQNQDGIRPASVDVTLNGSDGTSYEKTLDLTVDSGVLMGKDDHNCTTWSYTWNGLPMKTEDGKPITYTVSEDSVTLNVNQRDGESGYIIRSSGTEAPDGTVSVTDGTAEITNTHIPETVSYSIEKVWNHEELTGNNGTVPTDSTAVVEVWGNGEKVKDATVVTLNQTDSTAHTWNGLPKYEGGQPVTYHAVETEVNGDAAEHYSVTYDWTTDSSKTTITNTYKDTRDITLIYEWNDDNDSAGIRPERIGIQLYDEDGNEIQGLQIVQADANGIWSCSWTGLDTDKTYTAKVRSIDGSSIEGDITEDTGLNADYDFGVMTIGANDSVIIMDSTLDATAEVNVEKIWVDGGFGNRPDSITVQLYRDGTAEAVAELRGDDDTWAHTFDNLPVYKSDKSGEESEYTVKEMNVPAGYTAMIDRHTGGYTITNTLDGLDPQKGPKVTYVFNAPDMDNRQVSIAAGSKAEDLDPETIYAENRWYEEHTFAGWYEDITLNTEYDFGREVVDDITLYAKWTTTGDETPDVDDHTITFIYKNASATKTDEKKTPIEGGEEGKITVACKSDFSFIASAVSGYILGTPSLDDENSAKLIANGNGKFTLENITGNITVTIEATKQSSGGGGGGGGTVTPPKPALEKGDHYAYIIGYQDGTIRANGKITRAEVATIFFRLLTDESRDEFWSETNEYSDVSGDQWFNNAISTLANAGILTGYPDGTFRPNANITRAELAVIAAKFDDLTSGTSKLTDIEGHWAEDYINSAYNKGWVSGYPDGSYMPDNAITRAEVVTLVNRVLERAVDVEGMLDDMVTWSDNLPSDWYYEAIQEATNSHDYERPETEEFEEWTKIEEPRDWSELEG